MVHHQGSLHLIGCALMDLGVNGRSIPFICSTGLGDCQLELDLGTGVIGFIRQAAHDDHDRLALDLGNKKCPEDLYVHIPNFKRTSIFVLRNPPVPSYSSFHQLIPQNHTLKAPHTRHTPSPPAQLIPPIPSQPPSKSPDSSPF